MPFSAAYGAWLWCGRSAPLKDSVFFGFSGGTVYAYSARTMTATALRPSAALPSQEGDPFLYRITARGIWRFLVRQAPSFWLICFYLFIEYVRPQDIYEGLQVVPWGSLALAGAVVSMIAEGHWFTVKSPANWWLLAYTAVVVISCITAQYPDDAWDQLSLYLSWVLIYFLIVNIVNSERRLIVFMLSWCLYNFKMSQHSIQSWGQMGFGYFRSGMTGAPGWFRNSGEFGIEMCIFIPIVIFFYIALHKYWGKAKRFIFLLLPGSAFVGLVASTSRGAELGGAVVLLWFLAKSKHKVRALVLCTLTAGLLFLITPPEEIDRFKDSGTDNTSQARLQFWQDGIEITNQFPITGIGYNNWITYYRANYDPEGLLPHNIFIQASSELGYPGLILFVALIGCTFVVNARTRKIASRLPGGGGVFLSAMAHGFDGGLVGFLVSGFFVTVLYYPYFWINLAMTVATNNIARQELNQMQREQGWALTRNTTSRTRSITA